MGIGVFYMSVCFLFISLLSVLYLWCRRHKKFFFAFRGWQIVLFALGGEGLVLCFVLVNRKGWLFYLCLDDEGLQKVETAEGTLLDVGLSLLLLC